MGVSEATFESRANRVRGCCGYRPCPGDWSSDVCQWLPQQVSQRKANDDCILQHLQRDTACLRAADLRQARADLEGKRCNLCVPC
jgi:hypothetical protein